MGHWIRTEDALAELAGELSRGRTLALDSESDSLYHHFEKVCLLQIGAADGRAWLIDTLVLRDLSPLGPVLADPSIVKVLHGADYDVTTLKRDFGFTFASIFDTMIAARLLGRAEIGLAAVARDELGVALSKESQRDDWSRRPLSAKQEAYALADVQHLIPLRARLEEKLAALGRLEWLREECAAVAELPASRRREDPDAFLSVRGALRLPPRGLAALRELHAWRERAAARTDTPAFRILANDTLLRLAQERPADLAGFPGVPQRLVRDDDLRQALRRAETLPAEELPVPRRQPRPVVPEEVLRRGQRLKQWRTGRAQQLGVDVSVVLPQRLIDRLAAAAPRDRADLEAIEGLRRWRVDSFGAELLANL